MRVNVVRGLLGWSNKRTGTEFYRWDPKIIPRRGSEWGELLAYDEAIKEQEGAAVIVVVLPRYATGVEVDEAQRVVEVALGQAGLT